MKDKLFRELDDANAWVKAAAASVKHIHDTRASYNETITVIDTSKKRHVKGLKCTHYKTTHTPRNEVVFNHERFNSDLANANKVLREKQQKLFEVKSLIKREIDNAHSISTNHDSLKKGNQDLNSSVSATKAKLAHISTYNTSSAVSNHIQKKMLLDARKSHANESVKDLARKTVAAEQQIKVVTIDVDRKEAENTAVIKQAVDSRNNLTSKIASLDDTQRAKLAFNAASQGQEEMLLILKNCGYWTEYAANIAIELNDFAAFNRILQEPIDLDSFIGEEETTLALKVIASGKQSFIDKIFAQEQLLCNTAYVAFMRNDFASLQVMMKHDADIIDKIELVEASGLSPIQLAIGDSDLDKINFIKEVAPTSFSKTLAGYGSALYMALTYNVPAVIKEVASSLQNEDLNKELQNIVNKNDTSMLQRLIANVDIESNLQDLFINAVKSEDLSTQEMLLDKISDPKKLFASLLGIGDINVLMEIIEHNTDVITASYLEELLTEANFDSSISLMLEGLRDTLNDPMDSNISSIGVASTFLIGGDDGD